MANGHGGKRKGAGRKKGVSNIAVEKKRKNITEKMDAKGFCPIDGMMEVALEAKIDGDKKLFFDACKELAQYVAPKRKAVEISGDEDRPIFTKIVREIVDPKAEGS